MTRIETDNGLILITPVNAEDYQDRLLTADTDFIGSVQSPWRKKEIAAWRALVRMELGDVTISYNEVGAPVVSGSGKWSHIGVTHTKGYAAVIFSNSPCAIDMERTDRDFSNAAPRFVSQAESRLPGAADPFFLPAVWCAKETLYKISGCRELDLLRNIRILSVDFDAQIIKGAHCFSESACEEKNIKILLCDSLLVTFIA